MWSCIITVCVLVSSAYSQIGTLVYTRQGLVRGYTATDGNYLVFNGIPYGGSTSGRNRFKAPTPPPIFPAPFDASIRNIRCAQPSPQGLIGTEDCLTINIFTNNVMTLKPVFVWIDGEEYTTSNPLQHSFRTLVQEDLVVVSLNYRLSIFGFLCLGIEEAPGNAGLKDIIQGLEWVRDNIAAFGGNPNNVVLFGHGSGAAMVDLITMSPLAENLIHKVIVQSGSALSPWAVSYNPVGNAQTLGARLGFTGDNIKELAELFVNTTANRLATELNEFKFLDNTVLFAPCIDNKNLNPEEIVLPDVPIELLRAGNYSHIPYIIGHTNREGTLRAEQAANGQWLQMMQSNFADFLPADLNVTSEVEDSIRQFYFGNRTINLQNIEDYLDYHGDTMVLVPVIRSSFERALTSQAEVRLFDFGYMRTNNTDWPYQQIDLTGAAHGDMINFLLNVNLYVYDSEVMNSIISRYKAFAYTGIPSYTYTVGNDTRTMGWSPIFSINNQVIIHYFLEYRGGQPNVPGPWSFTRSVELYPYPNKMQFWNEIYSQHYTAPLPPSSLP